MNEQLTTIIRILLAIEVLVAIGLGWYIGQTVIR